jgi:hypothetical protein
MVAPKTLAQKQAVSANMLSVKAQFSGHIYEVKNYISCRRTSTGGRSAQTKVTDKNVEYLNNKINNSNSNNNNSMDQSSS